MKGYICFSKSYPQISILPPNHSVQNPPWLEYHPPPPANLRPKIDFIRLIPIRRIRNQSNYARKLFPNSILKGLSGENADDECSIISMMAGLETVSIHLTENEKMPDCGVLNYDGDGDDGC